MMGGGGGGGISRRDIGDLQPAQRDDLAQQELESDVNQFLVEELRSINDRDVRTVENYLDEIEGVLREEIQEFDRRMFGGSVAKHTFVDGLSDIDSLIVLSEGGDREPAEVRNALADTLRARLGSDVAEIQVGNLAVTVTYRDGTEIQLLPAVQQGDRLAISSPDGRSWTQIQPRRFARRLTDINQAQAGQVIPAIKLAKAIIGGLPESQRLAGYHVEALAVAAFENYSGSRTPKAMLTHFFSSAANNVRSPITDITGQSVHIDQALGPAGSPQRHTLSRALDDIAERMRNARSAGVWRSLLD